MVPTPPSSPPSPCLQAPLPPLPLIVRTSKRSTSWLPTTSSFKSRLTSSEGWISASSSNTHPTTSLDICPTIIIICSCRSSCVWSQHRWSGRATGSSRQSYRSWTSWMRIYPYIVTIKWSNMMIWCFWWRGERYTAIGSCFSFIVQSSESCTPTPAIRGSQRTVTPQW